VGVIIITKADGYTPGHCGCVTVMKNADGYTNDHCQLIYLATADNGLSVLPSSQKLKVETLPEPVTSCSQLSMLFAKL
jgi:hypothetical protein